MDWSWSELELEHIEQWPVTAKVMLFAMLSGMLCLASGYFMIAEHWSQWQQAQQQEGELQRVFIQKSQIAASLPAYQQQTAQQQVQLDALLQRLPIERNTAKMLHDVSKLAGRNGIKIDSLQWENARQRELSSEDQQRGVLSTELPLRLKAQGQYHQLGQFIAELSALPRIITIDTLEVALPSVDAPTQQLTIDLLAKTYTYSAKVEASRP